MLPNTNDIVYIMIIACAINDISPTCFYDREKANTNLGVFMKNSAADLLEESKAELAKHIPTTMYPRSAAEDNFQRVKDWHDRVCSLVDVEKYSVAMLTFNDVSTIQVSLISTGVFLLT